MTVCVKEQATWRLKQSTDRNGKKTTLLPERLTRTELGCGAGTAVWHRRDSNS